MQLLINEDRLVKDVQRDFNQAYPFLKIEFLKKIDTKNGQGNKQVNIEHNQKLSDACSIKTAEGSLIVEDAMSVAELEKAFVEKFGLLAQVFRKSGNIWLESTITDGWTLQQQNDLGREITTGKKSDDKDENDYELHRNED